MNKEWIANQVIGLMFGLTGFYIIGDWRLILGVFLILWGQAIQNSVGKYDKAGPSVTDKNWVE